MKNFFASFLGTLAALALAVTGVIVLFFGLIVGLSSLNTPSAAPVESGAYLVFDLSANITDAPVPSDQFNPAVLLGGDESRALQLRMVTRALREAALDKCIAGVMLVGSLAPEGFGSGFAALNEVRAALSD